MTDEGNVHPDAEVLTLAEVKEDQDYVLLMLYGSRCLALHDR